MNLKNILNEKFNFVKVKPNFKSSELIFPHKCIRNEIQKSYTIKALIFVQENLLDLLKKKNNFLEIISGNSTFSASSNRSIIYLVTSNSSSKSANGNKIITFYSKQVKSILNMSTFTLSQIIERNTHNIHLFVFQSILKEINVDREINENKPENPISNTSMNITVEANIECVSFEEKKNEISEKPFKEILGEMLLEIRKYMFYETWKPLGFANPRGYCYLNSVVQVLGSCEDFKNDIYKYKWISSQKTNDSIFVEGLFNLIKAIRQGNRENLNKSLNVVQQKITESSFGDDVYKCFMNLLTRVHNVIKTNTNSSPKQVTSLPITLSEKAEIAFLDFKKSNIGFVFDNFYGQLAFQTVCKHCDYVCNESFQMIKSLPLPVPKSGSSVTLSSCIDLFLNESDVAVDEPMNCGCKNGLTTSLKSITKLTHGPKYFFMYLNRGSYTWSTQKNNTHVTYNNLPIDIKTLDEKSIKYNLISVIDHIGNSAYGHYYCKCSFESEQWWLLNDSRVERLKNKNDVVTKNTIVFLFKIITNC